MKKSSPRFSAPINSLDDMIGRGSGRQNIHILGAYTTMTPVTEYCSVAAISYSDFRFSTRCLNQSTWYFSFCTALRNTSNSCFISLGTNPPTAMSLVSTSMNRRESRSTTNTSTAPKSCPGGVNSLNILRFSIVHSNSASSHLLAISSLRLSPRLVRMLPSAFSSGPFPSCSRICPADSFSWNILKASVNTSTPYMHCW